MFQSSLIFHFVFTRSSLYIAPFCSMPSLRTIAHHHHHSHLCGVCNHQHAECRDRHVTAVVECFPCHRAGLDAPRLLAVCVVKHDVHPKERRRREVDPAWRLAAQRWGVYGDECKCQTRDDEPPSRDCIWVQPTRVQRRDRVVDVWAQDLMVRGK